MGKGFGIAALILAILAIFVPLVGIAVTGLAIVLAVVAAFAGDRVLSTATALIALVDTFFLSPSITLVLKTSPIASVVGGLLLFCGAAPIAVVFGKKLIEDQAPRQPFSAPPPPKQDEQQTGNQSKRELVTHAKVEPTNNPPPNKPTDNTHNELARQSASPHSDGSYATNSRNPQYAGYISIHVNHYYTTYPRMIERAILFTSFEALLHKPVIDVVTGVMTELHITTNILNIFLLNICIITSVHCAILYWFFYPLKRKGGLAIGTAYGLGAFVVSELSSVLAGLTFPQTPTPSLADFVPALASSAEVVVGQIQGLFVCVWIIPAIVAGFFKEFVVLVRRE